VLFVGDPVFESEYRTRLKYFVNPCKQTPRYCLKIDHDHFIVHYSHLIINVIAQFYSTKHIRRLKSVVKKSKAVPLPPCRHQGDGYSSYSFLTTALIGVSGQRHARPRITPGGRTKVTTGWALDLVRTEARGKILCLCTGSNPGCPVYGHTLYWLSTPAPKNQKPDTSRIRDTPVTCSAHSIICVHISHVKSRGFVSPLAS
jgi:hypothetical protein